MKSEITDSESEWTRRAALEEIESLKVMRSTAWDEHTHSFRWLMASLLGINGAACLSALSYSEVPIYYKMLSCGFFTAGVLASLLVAVFGQHSIRRSLLPLQKLLGYWISVAEDGQRDEALEQALSAELKESARIGEGGRVAGWLAAALFIAGAASFGFGVQEEQMTRSSSKLQTAEVAKAA